jgi:Tfp pilus assembly protein PilF
MREMLGELLLEAKEPAQALKEFEASLRNNPNRYRSFAGAANAAERTGDRARVKNYYEKLVALTGNAENLRPDALTARRYLARQ